MKSRTQVLTVAVVVLIKSVAFVSAEPNPDLIAGSITFCDAKGQCSEELSSITQTFVRVRVDNVGGRDSREPFAVTLVIDDDVTLTSTESDAIPFGESRTITFSVGRLSPGAHRVSAVAELKHAPSTARSSNHQQPRTVTTIFPAPRRTSVAASAPARDVAINIPVAASKTDHATLVIPDANASAAAEVSNAVVIERAADARPDAQAPPATQASKLVAVETAVQSLDQAGAMVPEIPVPGSQAQGTLSGRITADSLEAAPGIGVAIYDSYGRLVDWRTTDASGEYVSGNLPPGRYQVAALRNRGWQDTIVRDLPVTSYERVRLRHGESFRSPTTPGETAGGDFYFGFFNDQPQFWANQDRQRGVMSLGDIRSTPLEIIVPPSAECESANVWTVIAPTSCYSRAGVEAVRGHTYAALTQRGTGPVTIVFRVIDVQPGLWVDLVYIITNGTSRADAIDVQDGVVTTGVDQKLRRVPAISYLAPVHGPADGGTRVNIAGANFHDGMAVSFGGVFATGVQVVSPVLMVATAPPHAGGAVDVQVWDGEDVASAANAYRFDIPAPGAFSKDSTSTAVLFTDPIVTLAWQPSNEALGYQICIDSVDDQRCTLDASVTYGWMAAGAATASSWARTQFAPFTTYYWQVRAINTAATIDADEGTWSSFAVASVSIAELITPTPGSTLTASETTFEWTAGTAVTAYHLAIGSAPGADDLYSSITNSRTAHVALPYDGRVLYVRVSSLIDGDWLSKDYAFTAVFTEIPAIGLGGGGPNPRLPRGK